VSATILILVLGLIIVAQGFSWSDSLPPSRASSTHWAVRCSGRNWQPGHTPPGTRELQEWRGSHSAASSWFCPRSASLGWSTHTRSIQTRPA